MIDKLKKAIEDFENEESELSIADRMSNLRKAWMWQAFANMKAEKISDEEVAQQEAGMKQFFILEKIYASEIKAAKSEGKKPADVDRAWLRDIKASEGTIGSIVRDMKDNNIKTG